MKAPPRVYIYARVHVFVCAYRFHEVALEALRELDLADVAEDRRATEDLHSAVRP